MAVLDLHRIKARDGLDLPVWVTTPPGKSSQPRPAIVLVHGGPWLRGTEWNWNADAQFLASRGRYPTTQVGGSGVTAGNWGPVGTGGSLSRKR